MAKTIKTGLVLQGGGALGAYQWGAIKAFEEQSSFDPCIVTGVSIGAINAAVYLSGGVEALDTLWTTIQMRVNPFLPQSWQAKESKIANPNMYYINPFFLASPLTALNIYDLAPFWGLLEKLIDIQKLNSLETKLVVEAVNVETGDLVPFSNHDKDGISLDKIVASMSIPPNFPAVKVDNNYYWDGGLFANMPLAPAINYLEAIEGHNIERELLIINLFRKNAAMPTNIDQISNRIKELMFESKLALDNRTFAAMDSYIDLIHKIDAVLPADSPIKQEPAYQKLMNHKKINKHTVLQYEAEGVEGTDDFTPAAMNLRFRTGYRDALTTLSQKNQLSYSFI
ncbi:Patatin phospholipase [Flexibacter flexilis DSM 6793]|uniref:Patatin phospholipase n=1 Tax=Flexibacter flexilis DSM 6793 TaxID=927664 RepID=A0A1I1LSD3_9BACT|nr:patatin-like phospholipase family protein [Flexibacter flexilis]SFC76147.1 Patatin phospholipase [Flexibacter flexilis DSM 6793]